MKKTLSVILSTTIYQIATTLIIPFALVRLYIKSRKNPAYAHRITERLCILPKSVKRPHDIWIHTVSVGEFIACTPLIKELIACQYQLLITTTTPTGSKLVREKLGNKVSHCYMPWDHYLLSLLFIKKVQPKQAIFMETEIWPNIISILNKQRIPTQLINARLSKKSLNQYKKFSHFSSHVFNQFTMIACQDKQSTQHFSEICHNAKTVGNLKFDIVLPAQFEEKVSTIKTLISNKTYLLAASTHEGEESLIIDSFINHDHHHFDCLIIAPRHPERTQEIINLVEKKHLSHSLFSKIKKSNQSLSTQILIVDTIGDLLAFYSMAELVFVGGSLVKRGGHNPLEPAYFAKPCLIGPNYYNFQQLVDDMLEQQAIQICTQEYLYKKGLNHLYQNHQQIGDNAKQFLNKNQGTISSYLRLIKSQQKK